MIRFSATGFSAALASLTFSGLTMCADAQAQTTSPAKLTMADLIKSSAASDWRPLDPANTLYLELPGGRVVMELAPRFAPLHVANIKALVAEGYFDGLAIIRAQDNFVVQWGDPEDKRQIQHASQHVPAELTVPYSPDLPFTRLPDVDGYAAQVGFSDSFAAARDPHTKQAWLTHCYGALGVGRDDAAESGIGTELYVVTGNAPRQLDQNVTVVGRVVQGIELLSTLPRGSAPMGFYDKPEQYVPIRSIRLAADVPEAGRSRLEVIRTDTPLFKAIVESLRNRGGDWYKHPAGHMDVCGVPLAVRAQQ